MHMPQVKYIDVVNTMFRSYNRLLSILMVFASLSAFSQSTTYRHALAIKTNPLELINFYNGSNVNVGMEIQPTQHWGLYTEYAHLISPFPKWLGLYDHHGYVVKAEPKFYFIDKDERKEQPAMNGFISLEVCYSRQAYKRHDTTTYDYNQVTYSYDTLYQLHRRFFGLVAQGGGQFFITPRFFIEVTAGLGVRFNYVRCDLTALEAEGRWLGDWNSPNNWIHKDGNHIIPKFNLCIRAGFQLW